MRASPISGRTLVGVILVAAGGLVLLETLNVADTGGLFKWIPSLFILLGVWRLVAGRFRNLAGPVVIIVIAGFVQLALLDVDMGDLWPVVLIVLGLAILFGGGRLRRRIRHSEDNNSVDALAIMGGSEKRITSQDFTGGQVTAVMGGVDIDLREAAIIDRPATVDVTAVMGGVDFKVPSDWNVRIDVLPVMGGADDERKERSRRATEDTDNFADDTPHLVITGIAVMGGVSVKD